MSGALAEHALRLARQAGADLLGDLLGADEADLLGRDGAAALLRDAVLVVRGAGARGRARFGFDRALGHYFFFFGEGFGLVADWGRRRRDKKECLVRGDVF